MAGPPSSEPKKATSFQEANLSKPIRELGLSITGTALEPIVRDFETELQVAGITGIRPHFYLSTEWGVPFDSVSIAIPFYLSSPELTTLQAERAGLVEGTGRTDILRYLRHEMGHVINYGYHLYEQEEWVKLFGSITQPYEEEYRPQPFSRRFVQHLPGWYAQKHPDEDWSETFAVWLTPDSNWQAEYRDWPTARAKLEYCERTMRALGARAPVTERTELDEDVSALSQSLEGYYRSLDNIKAQFAPGLDGGLRAIFQDLTSAGLADRPAWELVRRLERELVANIYRWTGHFPERTRPLIRHLAERARELKLAYAPVHEEAATVAMTTFVTALAMNYVHHGSYMP